MGWGLHIVIALANADLPRRNWEIGKRVYRYCNENDRHVVT